MGLDLDESWAARQPVLGSRTTPELKGEAQVCFFLMPTVQDSRPHIGPGRAKLL